MRRYVAMIRFLGMVVAVPLAVWFFALRASVEKWQEYRRATKDISAIVLDSSVISKSEVVACDHAVQFDLIDFVTCDNKVKVEKYNRYITATESDCQLITSELSLSGEFSNLLMLADRLEQESGWALRSLRLGVETDLRTRQQRLIMTLIVNEISK